MDLKRKSNQEKLNNLEKTLNSGFTVRSRAMEMVKGVNGMISD